MRTPRRLSFLSFSALLTASLSCGGGDSAAAGDQGDTGGTQTDSFSGDTTSTNDSARDDSSSTTDGGSPGDGPVPDVPSTSSIQTVFVIMMENHSWADIKTSASAAYINGTLVPNGSHAEQYFTPPGNHPSEPNYIWLEAGDNLGIKDDNDPGTNHKDTGSHFVSQLEAAGISWKAYAEDIDGKSCPLTSSGLFAAKHTAMLFFDDITDKNSATSKHCIDHVRPYSELASDLSSGKVARFNMITPNLCNDMHGESFGSTCNTFFADLIKMGDDWLRTNVPIILDSAAYKSGGALFIVWDEGSGTFGASDGPIGLIVLSPFAKGGGFGSTVKTDHSSTLATWETIFGVPKIRGAASATDLKDLFKTFP